MSLTPPADPRRVVTAKSVQYDDHVKTLVVPGGIHHGNYWITNDGLPTNDTNSEEDGGKRPRGSMPSDGTIFAYTDLAPHVQTHMHQTNSVDYNVLIHGKLVHITEDGTEIRLENPGDALIQKGTMHAWKNPTDEWVRWASVLISAKPVQ